MTLESKNIINFMINTFGFVKAKIGDVCEIKNGVRFTKSELTENENSIYPVYFMSVKPYGKHFKTNARKGSSIIINSANAGDVGFLEEDSFITSSVYSLTSDILEDKFLNYFLLSKWDYFHSKTTGLISRLSIDVIKNTEIVIFSRERQKQIVSILDSMKNECDYTEKLINQINTEYEFLRGEIFEKLK